MSEWNDGYIVEGCDRTHNLLANIEDLLLDHPSVVKADVSDKVTKVIQLLGEVYQAVGSIEPTDPAKELIVVTNTEQGWDNIIGVFNDEAGVLAHPELNEDGKFDTYEELKSELSEICYCFFIKKVL